MAAEDIARSWYEELPAAAKEEVRELVAEVGAITWLTDLDGPVEVGLRRRPGSRRRRPCNGRAGGEWACRAGRRC
jgi:hypothetical protein